MVNVNMQLSLSSNKSTGRGTMYVDFNGSAGFYASVKALRIEWSVFLL